MTFLWYLIFIYFERSKFYDTLQFISLGLVRCKKSHTNKGCIYLRLKKSEISNTVKRYYNLKTALQFKYSSQFKTVFLYLKFLFISVTKSSFSLLLQSSVSRDPSDIILICWFGAQETFILSPMFKRMTFNWIKCFGEITNSSLLNKWLNLKCIYTNI